MKSTIHTIKSRVAARTNLTEEQVVFLTEAYCENLKEILGEMPNLEVAVVWGTLKLKKIVLQDILKKLRYFKEKYESKEITLYMFAKSLRSHDDFLCSLSKKELKETIAEMPEEFFLSLYETVTSKYQNLLNNYESRTSKKNEFREHKRIFAGELQKDPK